MKKARLFFPPELPEELWQKIAKLNCESVQSTGNTRLIKRSFANTLSSTIYRQMFARMIEKRRIQRINEALLDNLNPNLSQNQLLHREQTRLREDNHDLVLKNLFLFMCSAMGRGEIRSPEAAGVYALLNLDKISSNFVDASFFGNNNDSGDPRLGSSKIPLKLLP